MKPYKLFAMFAALFLMAATGMMLTFVYDIVAALWTGNPQGSITSCNADWGTLSLMTLLTLMCIFGAWAYWSVRNGVEAPKQEK